MTSQLPNHGNSPERTWPVCTVKEGAAIGHGGREEGAGSQETTGGPQQADPGHVQMVVPGVGRGRDPTGRASFGVRRARRNRKAGGRVTVSPHESHRPVLKASVTAPIQKRSVPVLAQNRSEPGPAADHAAAPRPGAHSRRPCAEPRASPRPRPPASTAFLRVCMCNGGDGGCGSHPSGRPAAKAHSQSRGRHPHPAPNSLFTWTGSCPRAKE